MCTTMNANELKVCKAGGGARLPSAVLVVTRDAPVLRLAPDHSNLHVKLAMGTAMSVAL